MKLTTKILAAVATLALAGPAAAQEAAPASPAPATPATPSAAFGTGPQNTVTVNPLPLAFGMFSFEYERATSTNLSVFAAPSYWGLSLGVGDEEFSYSAYGLGVGVRYFFAGAAPEGFWVAPSIDLGLASAEYFGAEGSAFGFGAGAQLGYTWILGDVFDISLGLGAAFSSMEVEVEYEDLNGQTDTYSNGFSGVSPTLRFAIGPAF